MVTIHEAGMSKLGNSIRFRFSNLFRTTVMAVQSYQWREVK